MKKIIANPQILAFCLIFIAVLSRWLPHPANVAPITAVALFGGVYLNRKIAIVLPLLSMLISDTLLGFYGLVMFFVYGSFLLSALIGLVVRGKPSVKKIALASLVSSVLFFLITNFAVWQFGHMYTKNIMGLVECYISALPFFRNTVLGDLFYTAILFGLYRAVQKPNKQKSTLVASAILSQ